jgi:hypothetical protein
MSLGITAAGWVAIGTAVATTAYTADQSRKAVHGQMDAQNAAQQADATQAAEAETAAQVAANAKMAETKRRRIASTLGTGGGASTLGGGVNNVLAGGMTAQTGVPAPAARSATAAAATAPGGGTVLGAGAGGYVTPRAPARGGSY